MQQSFFFYYLFIFMFHTFICKETWLFFNLETILLQISQNICQRFTENFEFVKKLAEKISFVRKVKIQF